MTTRSIRNELDLNEKDGPTTTEVTAKSVNRNIEWWFEDDTTDAGDNMKYATHKKDCFTTAVTARSIRNELDLNEKDGPTTTEVTAKSVNRNIEWWLEDDTTDAGDNMKYETHQKDYFSNAESARSIRNELDLNEKDRFTDLAVTSVVVGRSFSFKSSSFRMDRADSALVK